MQKQRLGRTELMVSPVVYGSMIHSGESLATTREYIEEALDRGVNYFDVAPTYGDSQALLGPALAPHRQDVILACKTTERMCDAAQAELFASLNALHTDYFDLYQIHALNSVEDVEAIFGTKGCMEGFVRAKQDGIIRNIGITVHSEEAALRALELFDFDTIMFPFNWALGVLHSWGDRLAKVAKEKDLGVIAIKSLAHRNWRNDETRDYPKSWCKPFATEGKEVALALASMKHAAEKGAMAQIPPGNIEHFRFMLDNIELVLNAPLSNGERQLLKDEAVKIKDELIFTPPTLATS